MQKIFKIVGSPQKLLFTMPSFVGTSPGDYQGFLNSEPFIPKVNNEIVPITIYETQKSLVDLTDFGIVYISSILKWELTLPYTAITQYGTGEIYIFDDRIGQVTIEFDTVHQDGYYSTFDQVANLVISDLALSGVLETYDVPTNTTLQNHIMNKLAEYNTAKSSDITASIDGLARQNTLVTVNDNVNSVLNTQVTGPVIFDKTKEALSDFGAVTSTALNGSVESLATVTSINDITVLINSVKQITDSLTLDNVKGQCSTAISEYGIQTSLGSLSTKSDTILAAIENGSPSGEVISSSEIAQAVLAAVGKCGISIDDLFALIYTAALGNTTGLSNGIGSPVTISTSFGTITFSFDVDGNRTLNSAIVGV